MALELGALDAVIAKDLGEIPDLPDYKTPPAGTYALLVEKIEPKEIGEKTALQITYIVDTVLELVNAETPVEEQVIAGNKFTEAFFFDKVENIDMTLGALKKKVANLAEPFGTTNLKEILEKMMGMKINCIIHNRVDKKSTPHKVYAQVRDITLATS